MTKYQFKGQRGIDDLKTIYAFHGSSQGDDSRSNEISDYVDSKGWKINVFTDIDITDQQAIYNERDKRIKENEEYINKLKNEGRFGEEFITTIELVDNPMFDQPNILSKQPALESYRMVFLDFNPNNMPREIKPLSDLTDEDIMPSGKYSKTGEEGATKMIDVPAKYLLFIYNNDMCSQRVRKYIEDNLEVIQQQAKQE